MVIAWASTAAASGSLAAGNAIFVTEQQDTGVVKIEVLVEAETQGVDDIAHVPTFEQGQYQALGFVEQLVVFPGVIQQLTQPVAHVHIAFA